MARLQWKLSRWRCTTSRLGWLPRGGPAGGARGHTSPRWRPRMGFSHRHAWWEAPMVRLQRTSLRWRSNASCSGVAPAGSLRWKRKRPHPSSPMTRSNLGTFVLLSGTHRHRLRRPLHLLPRLFHIDEVHTSFV